MADLSSSNFPPEVVQFASGVKQYFYQAAAPTGWTIDATLGDAVLAVHGSSSYDGSGSGGEQRGTWTQPNHTHPFNAGTHVHTGVTSSELGLGPNLKSSGDDSHYHTFTTDPTGVSGTTSGGATASSWRPFANVGIIATKD